MTTENPNTAKSTVATPKPEIKARHKGCCQNTRKSCAEGDGKTRSETSCNANREVQTHGKNQACGKAR
jgi:hypothetical protein